MKKSFNNETTGFKSVTEAEEVRGKCIQKLEALPKSKVTAWLTSLFFVIMMFCVMTSSSNGSSAGGSGLLLMPSMLAWLAGLILTYRKLGGIGIAFKTALTIGKVAWLIVPVFPIDLGFGFFGFLFGFVGVFGMPVLILGRIRKNAEADLAEAEDYLSNKNAAQGTNI